MSTTESRIRDAAQANGWKITEDGAWGVAFVQKRRRVWVYFDYTGRVVKATTHLRGAPQTGKAQFVLNALEGVSR